MRFVLLLFVARYIKEVSTANTNLLKDGDFEDSNPHNHWNCNGGCKVTSITSDKKNGQRSVKYSGRTHGYNGPLQEINMQRNTRYRMVFYVKQLNKNSKVFQTFKIGGQYQINTGHTDYPDLAIDSRMHPGRGWVKLEVYIKTPDISFIKSRVIIQGPDPGIDFLVDAAYVIYIPEDTNWRDEANKRIDQYRKTDINFRINIPLNTNPHDFTVMARLVKHRFPFGSMIKSNHVLESKYSQYRNLYYKMFNWATLANYYWRWSHGAWNHPDYSKETTATTELKKHGIPVRAHNLFWGTTRELPDTVAKLSKDQLKSAVDDRIRYVVSATKGRVDHWDVNNEMLHEHYFEEKTGDPYYSHHMYSYLHQLDPHAKLFLNDYDIVTSGLYASAYANQAFEYKSANVGLYGLGIQCHFKEYVPPDPTLVKHRLNQLAATNYPVWVTELDVVVANENTRAKWYDTALRILFSYPSVAGIILWDFYGPEHWRGANAGLVDANYHVNAAGHHYMDLIDKEWSTHVVHNVGSGTSFSVRGFYGQYQVQVKYKGTVVKTHNFYVSSAHSETITVTDLHANRQS